jgi:hypothetical protein
MVDGSTSTPIRVNIEIGFTCKTANNTLKQCSNTIGTFDSYVATGPWRENMTLMNIVMGSLFLMFINVLLAGCATEWDKYLFTNSEIQYPPDSRHYG